MPLGVLWRAHCCLTVLLYMWDLYLITAMAGMLDKSRVEATFFGLGFGFYSFRGRLQEPSGRDIMIGRMGLLS